MTFEIQAQAGTGTHVTELNRSIKTQIKHTTQFII